MSEGDLLTVENLQIAIGRANVVDGVSFSVAPGHIMALVGESGCGKTLTALSVLRLLPRVARINSGRIRLLDQDMTTLGPAALARLRGERASIIFQEPVASLNPLMSVGAQTAEVLEMHRGLSSAEAWREAVAMLERVGISDAPRRARQYPFELSGGMCQRVMIAAALICRPSLLIADEPTTALDVTIQAQILDLMKRLRDEAGTSILLITHDMGVVADMADEVAVMYAGKIVETGAVADIFAASAHPYTKLLFATIPRLDGVRQARLPTIEGAVPMAGAWPQGCRFRTRCPLADAVCAETPPLASVGQGHLAACWHADSVAELV